MKRWKTLSLAIAVALQTLPTMAMGSPTPPDLPPTPLARQWIELDAGVVEARRALEAATHGAAALRASPNEWTTTLSAQRRRYDGGSSSNEWSASLERSIRIGGKADIDRQLGDIEMDVARASIAQARHEAARALADLWLDAVAASRQRELRTEQISFAQTSHKAVETRKRTGDASALDVNVALADLLDAKRQLSAATTNEVKAKAKLLARFPTLAYEPNALAEPVAMALDRTVWQERILAASDSLRIARGQLKKAELEAARTKADRIPDPTVGVFTASEASRSERIVGLSLSIPFSGTYRNERMQQALQLAEAARANVERQTLDTQSEFVETYLDALGALEGWTLMSQGLTVTRESAQLTQRAYTLGEADLQTLLLARRQALDASSVAEQARVDAIRGHYRLLIDAHLIWDLADD